MVRSLFDYDEFKTKLIEANKDYLINSIYDADGSVNQSVELEIDGYKYVSVYGVCSSPTVFKVEFSYDGVHWFERYTSANPETSYSDEFMSGAIYIRFSSVGTSTAGDTVSLIITAKK